jgi:DNA-binding MarR family transcriptional regulator
MGHREALKASFGHTLFTCARLLDEVAQAEVNREAGRRVARPALMRLLQHLDFEGIRPTELARRVDVSKQAVGQALAELQAQGLVEAVADATDGRARKVRLTAQGGAAFAHGLGVLAFFTRALEAEVGAHTVAATLEGLRALEAVLARWASTGAPRRPVPPRSPPVRAAPRTKRRRGA